MTAKQLELMDVSVPQGNVVMLYFDVAHWSARPWKRRAFTEEDIDESALSLAVRVK